MKTTPVPLTMEQKVKYYCSWKYDEGEDCWDTDCRNSFILNVGTPKENDFIFCPYCGRLINTDVSE